MNGKQGFARAFLIASALGALYLAVEAVLQSFGTSVCATEGCKVVSQYTRFGDLTMVLLGLGTVSAITILAARGMRLASELVDGAIDFLLIAALAGEGFFVGYQLFWLRVACIFCLSVFGIFLVLGLLRALAGRRAVLAGFGALAAVLSLFFLVLPAGGTAIPRDRQYLLFTSDDCKHCTEIRKEIEEHRIDVTRLPVREYSAFLKNMGIEHVPTLMVNGPREKIFLTGADAIRAYLFCQPAPSTSPRPAARPTTTPAGKQSRAGQPAGQVNLFAPMIGPDQIFNPRPDDGLCKEDVKCD